MAIKQKKIIQPIGNPKKEQKESSTELTDKSLHHIPESSQAFYYQGITLYNKGKLDEAAANFRQATILKPDFANAHYNLGISLYNQGKLDEAIASFRKALILKPDYVEAYNNLGVSLKDHDKLEEAIATYHQALKLKPDYVEAHNNLGISLKNLGKLDEAESSFRKALTLKPDFVEAYDNLGSTLKRQGKLEEAAACYRQAVTVKPGYLDAYSNLLLCLNYFNNQSVSQYLEEARNYGKTATLKVQARFSDWNCPVNPKRLSVGLVSGDFRAHSVGFFLENLLKNINLTKIDLIAYQTYQKEDELTKRIRSRFTAWKPIMGTNDEAAARLIHDDGVHVLIDLSGHTAYNRLPVFAWKSAPVQVNWLGYSASTGLDEMDYLLADPYVIPPGEEAYFTETIWRLPESYLCFTPPLEKVKVSSLPALKEGLVTFGCFNNPTKINERAIAVWAKILHNIPYSQLILKASVFSNSKFCEKTRQRFAVLGIAPERILLEGFIQKREDHLEAYNRIDIALDPFPYNGTTTTIEGLWMGVPFITLKGDRFVSHVGESIAHNAGLSDWIAADEEDYVAKALAHTSNLDKLSELRNGLRQQVVASPLFDGPRFARNFEDAMWGMWNRFQDGQ